METLSDKMENLIKTVFHLNYSNIPVIKLF